MAAWHDACLIARMALHLSAVSGSAPGNGVLAGSFATKVGDTEFQT